MAHILPDRHQCEACGQSLPRTWDYPMASLPPECPHGVPYAQRCNGCGWVCPTCKRSYAPWVRECNYRHEEDWQQRMGVVPGTFAPVTPDSLHAPLPGPGAASMTRIALPPQWGNPGYQHFVRAGGEWREVMPDLQVLLGQPFRDGEEAILHFRLTPRETGS